MRKVLAALALVIHAPASACSSQPIAQPQRSEFWGFTGPWDRSSDASVGANGGRLDAVVTGWITLDTVTGRPLRPSLYRDTVRLVSETTRRMAIVSTSFDARFHARPIRRLGGDRALLANVAGSIAREAEASGYRGLVIDFEALEPADLPAQLAVVKAIADSAHARGISPVTVAVPAEDTVAYPARRILEVADLVLVMLYDQHWIGSSPGPVSARDWVRRTLAMRIAEAGASRLVAGLPLYGYRWRTGAPTEIVGYGDAQRIATSERVSLTRDAASGALRGVRAGEWEMWVTDAVLLGDLVSAIERAGVRRFALWRLGQEDPAIWGRVIPARGDRPGPS
jgi:spore germination protein YaaH